MNANTCLIKYKIFSIKFRIKLLFCINFPANNNVKKIVYLGGFAGGSDLLLSTSENGSFFSVVIIRGGFGGP